MVSLTLLALLTTPPQSCPLFEIHRTGKELSLVRSEVAEGRTEVLSIGKEGFVSVVVPLSEGQAGDLVRTTEGGVLIARCQGDSLRILVQRTGQAQREVFAQAVAELKRYRISVGVTAWDGVKQRFQIKSWSTAAPESGPVLDLFGGKIPLQTGDYSVTTDIARAAASTAPTGSFPVEQIGGYWMARGRVGNSGEGWWVVDLAAGMTLISAAALPADAIRRVGEVTQSSAEGTATGHASLTGAGGEVAGGFSVARLPNLVVGGAQWDAPSIVVLPTLPRTGGQEIMGILGVDLLARGAVQIEPPSTGHAGRIQLGAVAPADPTETTLTLARMGTLFTTPITVNGASGWAVLDTGAPFSVVSAGLGKAARLKLTPPQSGARIPKGLDGRPLQLDHSSAAQFALGSLLLHDVAVRVGELPVLDKLSAREGAALLGSDLLGRFRRIIIEPEALRARILP